VIYALRVGELPVATGRAIAYLSIDEHGIVAPVVAANDEAGLREIVAGAGGREVICEEALGPAARRLGLRVQPLPPWTLGPRAELATFIHLGEAGIEPGALPAVGPALHAAGELISHQPWSWLLNGDVVDFEIATPGRPPRHFEGCVMGAGGQEFGVALYDQPGSLARLAKASERGRPDKAHAIDAYGFTLDGGPRWVAEAVAAAYGVEVVIAPIRLRGGQVRAVSADDLTVMASAAAAAAHLTPERCEHVATIMIANTPVTATARLRAPRTKPRRPRKPAAAEVAAVAQGPNAYCAALGIAVPSLATVRDHPEANSYALMIVALLEHGGPMTLAQVAARFEAAGIAPAEEALRALQRCRPARPPIYRDGDRYALDARDAEADLWAFRLGLRPPKHAGPQPQPQPQPPRASRDARLTTTELDEAWRDADLTGWSAQRLALAVLDAHDRAMSPDQVVAFVSARTSSHRLAPGPTTFRRTSAAVAIGEDGTWTSIPGAPELPMARDAVRDAIERNRRHPARSTPAEIDASMKAAARRRDAHAAELAVLRRVIVHAFPPTSPKAVVLVDVASRGLTTLVGSELAAAGARILAYDVIAGVDIRAVLRKLGVDPGDRRLAELGPPQKSVRLNRGGRTLKITTAMLIQGSCGISRPLGDDKKLRGYLEAGQDARLRLRLEADAKALFALHEYGRLHGAVRLRWGFLDQMFPAPWLHRDEPTFYALMREARSLGLGILAVIGPAPGWEQPWARAQRLEVEQGRREHDLVLVDDRGTIVDECDVQLARLEIMVH
jgi:hypothetical protein